jgi:hypothetical protein
MDASRVEMKVVAKDVLMARMLVLSKVLKLD